MKYADNKRQQAKHISDAQIIEAVRATRGRNRVPRWSTTSDVASHFPQFHYKVVMAKLRSAIRRKIIDGCACGCRGDFEVPGDKMIALQDVNGRQLTEWAWWDGGEVRVDAIASGAPRWLLVDDGRSVKRVWFTP